MNILVLSAHAPFKSLNLGKDIVDGFKMHGCDVDYVGAEDYDTSEESYYSLRKINEIPEFKGIRAKLTKISILRKIRLWWAYAVQKRKIGNIQWFVHLDDSRPRTSFTEWRSHIPREHYDLIVTIFLEHDITSITIEKLCRFYKCPLLIWAVDMQPMTGGCFYFMNCTNYLNQCKNCPTIGKWSEDVNLPFKNFDLKQRIFRSLPVFVGANSYMMSFFRKTALWQDNKYVKVSLAINEDVFKPEDVVMARRKFGIKENDFVIFSGSQRIFEERKGIELLIQAIDLLRQNIDRINITLIIAGDSYGRRVRIPHVRVKQVGYLKLQDMISAYSAANVYACASLDDAGPSMVNQSLMCGTPVVSFNLGVAQDFVIDGITGYRAVLGDACDFAKGLQKVYMKLKSGFSFREECRNLAIANFSRYKIAGIMLKNCLITNEYNIDKNNEDSVNSRY